jgi:signal transduction histidine kinase
VRELQAVAQSLRELGAAQHDATCSQRLRARHLLAAQEAHCAALARQLHETAEAPLTGARVDLAWLQRRLHGQAPYTPVLDGLRDRLAALQRLLRAHAARLQPLADSDLADPERLRERLLDLTDIASTGGGGLQCEIEFDTGGALREVTLPPALLLAVYRMCEVACRLAAHDAVASTLRLQIQIDARAALLLWTAEDDGRGALTGPPRDGPQADWLACLEAIAWSWGGELRSQPGTGGRGLRLTAHLPLAAASG